MGVSSCACVFTLYPSVGVSDSWWLVVLLLVRRLGGLKGSIVVIRQIWCYVSSKGVSWGSPGGGGWCGFLVELKTSNWVVIVGQNFRGW